MNPNTLREAHSTPYIRSDDEGAQEMSGNTTPQVDEKENSRGSQPAIAVPEAARFALDGVHFNTGCSSSSTDLTKVMDFYNESADPDVVAEWMKIYQKQRMPVHQHSSASEEHRRSHNTLLTDSTESLSQSTSREGDEKSEMCSTMQKRPVNRSMDVLPTINEGFYTLEKCVSVEFPPKLMVQPSRLCRSKEMPNIADVDDYE